MMKEFQRNSIKLGPGHPSPRHLHQGGPGTRHGCGSMSTMAVVLPPEVLLVVGGVEFSSQSQLQQQMQMLIRVEGFLSKAWHGMATVVELLGI